MPPTSPAMRSGARSPTAISGSRRSSARSTSVALAALNQAGIRYVVTGAYAIYEYTGIYRETKDLDLFVEPEHLVAAMKVPSRSEGFKTRLEQAHWLAKAKIGEHFVDMIFGMGNGLALVDSDWFELQPPRHSRGAIPCASGPWRSSSGTGSSSMSDIARTWRTSYTSFSPAAIGWTGSAAAWRRRVRALAPAPLRAASDVRLRVSRGHAIVCRRG
jgi:hypothetical protein